MGASATMRTVQSGSYVSLACAPDSECLSTLLTPYEALAKQGPILHIPLMQIRARTRGWYETQRAQYGMIKEYALNGVGTRVWFKVFSSIKLCWALWEFLGWQVGEKLRGPQQSLPGELCESMA